MSIQGTSTTYFSHETKTYDVSVRIYKKIIFKDQDETTNERLNEVC